MFSMARRKRTAAAQRSDHAADWQAHCSHGDARESFRCVLASDWDSLGSELRSRFAGKLAGLYSHANDHTAFDQLALDKRASLFLLAARLCDLDLWHEVQSVENLYGTGGVGATFSARASLLWRARHHAHLCESRWATKRGAITGFFERFRAKATLHLVLEDASRCRWSAHFDRLSPIFSVKTALGHLLGEKLLTSCPDWREISAAIGLNFL